MPKIMFRPAPTPPPFVPPTPVPTENLIHINPYPFNEGDSLQVTLSNLAPFSGYIVVEFGMFVPYEGDVVIYGTIAQAGEPIPTNFNVDIDYSSEEIDYYVLNVIMQQGVNNFIRLNLI